MFDARFRTAVDRVVSPAGRALQRTGLSPDHLTASGIALSVPAAWAIAAGHLVVGMVLVIMSALPDVFDGSLAKASGRTSRRGAFFDSVGDRVSDSVVLAGMAWYAQDRFGGHAALVPLAVLGASQLVSYIRAKGDALGIDAKGGLMERGERVLVLCFALKFPADMLWLLWVVFALSCVTAGQRFVKVWRQAEKPPAPLPVEPTAVVLRWRAWREERAARDVWWARAQRASSSPASRGFFAGSRRPGGPGSGRWHERRVSRRQRFDPPGAMAGDEVRSPRRRGPGGG
ncbi:MAG: CDP-alcohol phosphatidyltransferase family protein [Acidimicrobiales bacterium]